MFPETVHIVVTQDHIDDGIGRSCEACPIALAALPHFLGCKVLVGDGMSVRNKTDHTKYAHYIFGPEVERFINTFDSGIGPVQPFEFDAVLESYAF